MPFEFNLANIGLTSNNVNSFMGILTLFGFMIVGMAVVGYFTYLYIQKKQHNIEVEIFTGDQGTIKIFYDRGRLFGKTETYQTSFHLFKKKIYVPNIDLKKHVVDGHLKLIQTGNLRFLPVEINFKTGEMTTFLEEDFEFYADGIRRSLERKQGKLSAWEKYSGIILVGGSIMMICMVQLFVIYQQKDTTAAFLRAAEIAQNSCRAVAYTVVNGTGAIPA